MIAYFDCFSGISGDMTLGALIDLGVPQDWIEYSVSQLPIKNFYLRVTSEARMGIHGTRVKVETQEDSHTRNYKDIRSLIKKSYLSEIVKNDSLLIFERLAKAESKIHNCSLDQVHFHEIGGVDAIVDIVGTALSIEYLKIKEIIASKIPVGTGFVSCAHGNLPVPVPATTGLLKGVPVYGTGIPRELVTPTGAAIITALAKKFDTIPSMIIKNSGYGVGTQEIESRPNLLRIILGKYADPLRKEHIIILETAIDDMNPEIYGFLMERLLAEGALDVIWIPVQMKKNRPGTLIQVLCRPADQKDLSLLLLSETTTTGVRYKEAYRTVLPRENIEVSTSYGKIKIKKIIGPNNQICMVPEYEECRRLALEKNLPIKTVYQVIGQEITSL
ncbi:putative nickel insertion protein [Candidatus Magnetomoraceae bacterium gMMP-15]